MSPPHCETYWSRIRRWIVPNFQMLIVSAVYINTVGQKQECFESFKVPMLSCKSVPYIKLFSSSSAVKLACCMSLHWNIPYRSYKLLESPVFWPTLYICKWCLRTASASGGPCPQAPYQGFGPGPHWITSIFQTPWATAPKMKFSGTVTDDSVRNFSSE